MSFKTLGLSLIITIYGCSPDEQSKEYLNYETTTSDQSSEIVPVDVCNLSGDFANTMIVEVIGRSGMFRHDDMCPDVALIDGFYDIEVDVKHSFLGEPNIRSIKALIGTESKFYAANAGETFLVAARKVEQDTLLEVYALKVDVVSDPSLVTQNDSTLVDLPSSVSELSQKLKNRPSDCTSAAFTAPDSLFLAGRTEQCP